MVENLSPRRRKEMEKILHGSLERAAATLGMILGDPVHIIQVPPQRKPSGVSVWLGLEGALAGGVCLDLPENVAIDAVKRLNGGVELSLLDETARSMLMELGNLLASVFVAYYDQKRGLRTLPTPPTLSLASFDMPEYDALFSAQVGWGGLTDNAELLIGLDTSAIDMLID